MWDKLRLLSHFELGRQVLLLSNAQFLASCFALWNIIKTGSLQMDAFPSEFVQIWGLICLYLGRIFKEVRTKYVLAVFEALLRYLVNERG